jgi:hypothetical protein
MQKWFGMLVLFCSVGCAVRKVELPQEFPLQVSTHVFQKGKFHSHLPEEQ